MKTKRIPERLLSLRSLSPSVSIRLHRCAHPSSFLPPELVCFHSLDKRVLKSMKTGNFMSLCFAELAHSFRASPLFATLTQNTPGDFAQKYSKIGVRAWVIVQPRILHKNRSYARKCPFDTRYIVGVLFPDCYGEACLP